MFQFSKKVNKKTQKTIFKTASLTEERGATEGLNLIRHKNILRTHAKRKTVVPDN